jgi:hypothetical protein
MPHKNPLIVYDYEAYVIYVNYFPELKFNKIVLDRPQYGSIETLTKGNKGPFLHIDYQITFLSSGFASIDMVWVDPWTREQRRQTIEASLVPACRQLLWHIDCFSKSHKECSGKRMSSWLGKTGKFMCQNCGKVRRFAKTIERDIAPFRKNPALIIATMNSPFATERKKKNALIALEKLNNRFKKMTDNYENLTPWERKYYKKLRYVLFYPDRKKGSFKPSKRLDSAPLPFQSNF